MLVQLISNFLKPVVKPPEPVTASYMHLHNQSISQSNFYSANIPSKAGVSRVPSHQDPPLGVAGRVRRKGKPIWSVAVQL